MRATTRVVRAVVVLKVFMVWKTQSWTNGECNSRRVPARIFLTAKRLEAKDDSRRGIETEPEKGTGLFPLFS